MKIQLVCVVLVALVAGVAAGNDDPCGGDDYGTSGDFDFYVFAQSWPAQFCQAHSSWPGCSNPTKWQQRNLTLHGMWPNYAQSQSGHDWPQCCSSTYGSDLNVAVAKALLPEWKTYWPNEQDPTGGDLANSLWAHEWGKHGTCSGLDQKTYFQTAMNIELSMPTPDAITQNIGDKVSLSDLQSAFNATGCSDGSDDCWTGFGCQNQNGQQYLASVTTCWDQDANQITCPSAVLTSQGNVCTDDNVYIQSF